MRVAMILPLLLISLNMLAEVPDLRSNLITPRSFTNQLLIPAAGNVAGGNGTFFRSDVTLTNFRDVDQRVSVRWMPRAVEGATIAPVFINLPRMASLISEDFVGQELQRGGLGSIVITAVRPDNTTDPDGRLHATSRIWTRQPAAAGTVSQTFPAIALAEVSASGQIILGHRQNAQYRTNVGVINLDAELPQNFEVAVYNTVELLAAITVELPPLSMQQIALPTSINTDFLRIDVNSRPTNLSRLPLFVSYGASVDNVTGDGWSSLGFVIPGQ